MLNCVYRRIYLIAAFLAIFIELEHVSLIVHSIILLALLGSNDWLKMHTWQHLEPVKRFVLVPLLS